MAYVETSGLFADLLAQVKAKKTGVTSTTTALTQAPLITSPLGPRRPPPPAPTPWYRSTVVLALGAAALAGGFFFLRRKRRRR
jgi:LPXTG-motif cell wall-anchored protein